jgi:hypothetical protein
MAGFADHPARLASIAAGFKCFDPGEPCANGHRALRYVREPSFPCVECDRLHLQKRRAKKDTSGLIEEADKQAAERFGFKPSKKRAGLAHAVASYDRSDEAAQHSAHLDRLLKEMKPLIP